MRASVMAPIIAAAIAIDCTSAFLAGTFLSCPAINRERPRKPSVAASRVLASARGQFTPSAARTNGRRLVPVAAGYVFADEQRPALDREAPLDLGFEARRVSDLNCLTAGFGNELVLEGEMAVETAVGEPGSPHQPGETSLRDSWLRKLGARRLEYALACFGRFLLLTYAWIDSPASKTLGLNIVTFR